MATFATSGTRIESLGSQTLNKVTGPAGIGPRSKVIRPGVGQVDRRTSDAE